MSPLAAVVLTVIAALIILLIARDAARVRHLPALDSNVAVNGSPLISFVIPARNEADNIARCLDGVLSQTYANYEVVVVDDGSTDTTPRILTGYAARHPNRLRVVPGRPLPTGWAGKCNACLCGAQHAQGEWLVFLDADTVPEPALATALMVFVQQRRLDAVSVFPFNMLPTWPEQLVLPVFYQFALTAFPLHKVVAPEAPPHHAMANGQCLMVAAQAYWALGGHEAVKDKVLEDIEFAQALRRANYRLGIATAFQQLRVRMYSNLSEIVQGLGKHVSAGRRASGWRAFWAALRMSLTLLAPIPLLLACVFALLVSPGHVTVWLPLVASGLAVGTSWWFWGRRLREWYNLRPVIGVFMPLGWLIYLFVIVRGTFQVAFKRGVTWKGRVY